MMKAKKKICILPNRLMLGGIEKVLLDALEVLHKEFDIESICFCDEKCTAVLEKIPQNVTVAYRTAPSGFWSKIPGLSRGSYRKALGDGSWDYLLVLRPSVLNAVFAGKAKKTVFWCHNDHYRDFKQKKISFKKWIAKGFRRMVYRKYDMVWTVSDVVAKEMEECFSLKNVHALPNPLNCGEIQKKAQEPCDIRLDLSKTNFMMIGRMSQEKGFSRVLQFMCRNVLPKYPNVQLYLIGNDTDNPRLQQRIQQLGMSERICLLGPKGNPYPYLKQAQCLICPSENESFGLVMLEAMLLGVRVITTNTVGGVYVTQNGTYGCCVPNSNQALEHAVEQYLEHPESYHYDMNHAEKWALSHDITRFGERLQELLKE